MVTFLAILAAAGVLATAVVTGFFVSYAKKSGENLATKEDLNNLVEQVKAVTQATKAGKRLFVIARSPVQIRESAPLTLRHNNYAFILHWPL
jgi:hypothetical protein